MQRKIFFALPSKDDAFCTDTTFCLMSAVGEIMREGWHWHAEARQFDHYIDRARNVMVSQFLKSDATDLVWIDDDVAWAPGELVRLVNHPVDLVGGAYRVKDVTSKRYTLRFTSDNFARDQTTGLIDVTGIGFGFVRIRRDALQRFIDQRLTKDEWYTDHLSGLHTVNLFDIRLKPDHSGPEGEDFTFCAKWIEEGGKVWLDPDLHLTHVGVGRFPGCLADDLAAAGQQQPLHGRAA